MIRYIKFEGSAYYVGTEFEEYLKTDMSDKELDEYARELARENAISYEYLVFGWNAISYEYLVFGWNTTIEDIAEEENCSIEEAEEIYQDTIDYYASCDCSWSIVTEEEWRDCNGDTIII